jgi:DNA-binding LacI/PurR family transcriptional regulator
MDDFARSCGVSRPTLSKYFDDPASVKPATRQRIEAALDASDYRPNLFARNLNRKRTRSIGILVPTLADPFYAEMVGRIELALRDAGYWPVVISSHGLRNLEAEAARTLLSLKVSGALVAPLGRRSDANVLGRLTAAIPIVYFDTFLEGETPFVGNDNERSMATMVDYLCRSGEPPAYFDIPHVNHNSAERLAGYVGAMRRNGQEPVVFGETSDYTWDFERIGYEQMQALLASNRLPGRTILCANDRLAFGVMAAAHALGRKVGRGDDSDLRVAAHDDHPLSRYACPALTTMAQDFAAMSARAVEILLASLDDGEAGVTEKVRLPATLVMRQSA